MGWLGLRRRPSREHHVEEEERIEEAPQRGPLLSLLVPDIAGVASFRLCQFYSPRDAAALLLTLPATTVSGVHAFWALHQPPVQISARESEGEAMVLMRSAPGSETVYVVSFVDLSSASSFARFEVKRGMDLGLLMIYWAALVRVAGSHETGYRLIPEAPPESAEDLRAYDFEDSAEVEAASEAEAEAEAEPAPAAVDQPEEAAEELEVEADEPGDEDEPQAGVVREEEPSVDEGVDTAVAEEVKAASLEEEEPALEVEEATAEAEEPAVEVPVEAAVEQELEVAAPEEVETTTSPQPEPEAVAEPEPEDIAPETQEPADTEIAEPVAEAEATEDAEEVAEEAAAVNVELIEPAEAAEAADEPSSETEAEVPPVPAAAGEEAEATTRVRNGRSGERLRSKLEGEEGFDQDLAEELNKILKVRRWEKKDRPFKGFESPPGRF